MQEAGWVPGPVWTGAENLALTGIRSPDRPARSQSLYRLSYPAHMFRHVEFNKMCFTRSLFAVPSGYNFELVKLNVAEHEVPTTDT